MNPSMRSARRDRSPRVVVALTERAKQRHTARLLGRSNELLQATRAFSVWVAAIRERRLQTHLKRCSTMLKYHSLRQGYSRYFMQWLAFTQTRTSESMRSAIRLRQDVPLRSKADFLHLARRYFAKWRLKLRERNQRTVTNVELLEALNKERLRSRMLLKWWSFHNAQTAKHHAIEILERENDILDLQQELQKTAQATKSLRNQLDSALQQQSRLQNDLEATRDDLGASKQQHETEVNELREAMRQAVKLMEGSSSLRLHSLQEWDPTAANPCSTSGASTPLPSLLQSSKKLLESARQSKHTAETLLHAVGDTLASLTLVAKMPTPPASLKECVAHLGNRLSEEAREAATIKAQRDELALAAQTTRATLAAASPLLRVDSAADSGGESSREPSLITSPTRCGFNISGRQSALRISGGGRRSGAPAVTFGHSSSAASVVDGAAPSLSSRSASPAERSLIDFQKLSRLLIEDAKAVVGAMQVVHQDGRRSTNEVKDLQDAALRAIDALGGRGATNTDFMEKPQESDEDRASRSANIADSLRNLCEDMVVVLVLTSLWSGKGASERVSEALERLWHRTQDLEAAHADYRQQLEQYAMVVHTTVAILRPPPAIQQLTMSQRTAALLARRRTSAPPDDAMATPEQVDVARRIAEKLADKGDRRPTELLELCLQAQQRAAAEQSSVPENELDGLVKSAHEIIAVVVGKTHSRELGVELSLESASQRSRLSRSAAPPETSDSAAEAEVSQSRSVDPPTAKVVATTLKAVAAVAAETLRRTDGVADSSLLDALACSWEQVDQLQEQLKALAASEQRNAEGKKRLQMELKEAVQQSKASENIFKQHLDDLEKARGAAERDLHQQVKALQREAAQRAQDCKKLEVELEGLEEDNRAKDLALHAQTEALEKERREHAERIRRLREEIGSLQSQLAAAEVENSLSGEANKVLHRRLVDQQRKQLNYDAAVVEFEGKLRFAHETIETAAAARQELTAQLLAVEEENRTNIAIGVFLRDVLRDCLTRLHHMTRNLGDTAASKPSPRASLTLQEAHERPPPILTCDSNPSEYVEYILQLDGNNSTGKQLVQEHLRENVVLHGLRALCVDGGAAGTSEAESRAASAGRSVSFDDADPSTWEVVAELHDRFVLLYDRIAQMDKSAAEQRAHLDALTAVKDQLTADVLAGLVELQPWSSVAAVASQEEHHTALNPGANGAGSPPHTPALRAACAEVAQALEAMQKVAALAQPLMEMRSSGSPPRRANISGPLNIPGTDAAATKRLLSLVADVQDMADCLQHLSESVIHGILALGGTPDEAALNTTNGMAHPHNASSPMATAATNGGAAKHHSQTGVQSGCVDSHLLAARLEAICKETGTSVQEVKQLMDAVDGANNASSASSMPGSSRMVRLSDMLPFIRSKMQELQAVKRESEQMLTGLDRAFKDDDDDSISTSMSSTQRSLKPKQKPLPAFQGTPESGLCLMQQEMKSCRKKASRRPGDFASVLQDTKATVRERIGDLQSLCLASRSILQVLEGRFLKDDKAEQPPRYGEALVALLTTQIEDLKQALPETEEALAGYRSSLLNVTVGTRLHLLCSVVCSLKLERDSLKEDLARHGRQGNMLLNDFSKEAKLLRAEIARLQEEQERLARAKASASDEVEAQKRNVAELAATLTSFQLERNVLCEALAHSLRGLPGTPYRRVPLASVQENLLAALTKEQGKPLTVYVEAALRSSDAHQQRLQDILHGSLGELRCGMAVLRTQVENCWDLYGRPMANAAAQQFMEATEVLALENNMLRPRAIEREKLMRGKAELEAALADAEEARADVVARLERADDENTQLRRALRDAQMAQALTNGDDNEEDKNKWNQRSGKLLRAHSVEWERRMIDGATELTMNAVNSMSGTSMSAVFGSVVEETLRIYAGVRRSVQGIEAAYVASRGKDEHHVQTEVEQRLQELRTLSESANYLSARLPVLYREPYP
ncbi:hypothetical protein Q4I30_005725 [Leishmania utingensis]|uniref:Uncharacterized protein n=1 Tax=Leishmania utingensis TaxID=653362 RepID=A0AAW3A925_9TRYP